MRTGQLFIMKLMMNTDTWLHTQGSPMVNRVINEMNLDTAYVQVFFYGMMKTYQDLSIQINKNPSGTLQTGK